jgi:hypothetical protein
MKYNKIEEKTIIEYETELSHKTLDITKFKEYLQVKNHITPTKKKNETNFF